MLLNVKILNVKLLNVKIVYLRDNEGLNLEDIIEIGEV